MNNILGIGLSDHAPVTSVVDLDPHWFVSLETN